MGVVGIVRGNSWLAVKNSKCQPRFFSVTHIFIWIFRILRPKVWIGVTTVGNISTLHITLRQPHPLCMILQQPLPSSYNPSATSPLFAWPFSNLSSSYNPSTTSPLFVYTFCNLFPLRIIVQQPLPLRTTLQRPLPLLMTLQQPVLWNRNRRNRNFLPCGTGTVTC